MSFLWFLIIGAAAGWLAGQIMKGRDFGLWLNLLLGIVGSFVGGFLFESLGIGGGGIIFSLVAAVVGAVVLLWVVGMVKKK